jgi:hypothetical protein
VTNSRCLGGDRPGHTLDPPAVPSRAHAELDVLEVQEVPLVERSVIHNLAANKQARPIEPGGIDRRLVELASVPLKRLSMPLPGPRLENATGRKDHTRVASVSQKRTDNANARTFGQPLLEHRHGAGRQLTVMGQEQHVARRVANTKVHAGAVAKISACLDQSAARIRRAYPRCRSILGRVVDNHDAVGWDLLQESV